MTHISMFFGGDFAPCRRYENLIIKKGANIFGNLNDDIQTSDISFLNLETPLSETAQRISKSGPTLQAHPDCLKSVAQSGFNVVGLANNHIMDSGPTGLTATIKTCEENKLIHVGANENIEQALQPVTISCNNFAVSIIAVAEQEFNIAGENTPGAAPLDIIHNIAQIEKAKKDHQVIIMSIHGGNEFFNFPRPGLRRICQFYIEQGVHAVICHHSHVSGAYEIHQGRPIFYGLGNLIFDHNNPPEGWDEGYAVKLNISLKSQIVSNVEYEIIPYKQSVELGGVVKCEGKDKQDRLLKLENMRNKLETHSDWMEEWDKFCAANENSVLLRQFSPFAFPGIRRLSKIIPFHRWLVSKKHQNSKLNMVRCDSHRELLINIMEKL
ncbi:MAG: hypothetical protein COB24_00055 [Hyphomicrobiales bacterium]|nr:MAG: hypothetical protein COB24_00055 [Hyphomicrobiales bacterium]